MFKHTPIWAGLLQLAYLARRVSAVFTAYFTIPLTQVRASHAASGCHECVECGFNPPCKVQCEACDPARLPTCQAGQSCSRACIESTVGMCTRSLWTLT